MASAPSFYNQSSVLRINIMVVDDDPIFLKTFSRKLEKSKHRDPSVMEITVIPEKGPMEALSTLQVQRNNIDLIITDYYMPVMNGLQLKHQITQEFGNLPILVISADKNKEEESLSCGALSFFSKPIKETDLPRIYQFALTYKRNGKSIMSSTELNHKDTHVSIPKQINLLPDPQANVVKTKKRDSDSIKIQKRNPNGGASDDGEPEAPKKAKFIWTDARKDLFVQALAHIGHDKAVPKKILDFMNLPDLTVPIVASHLQKYRIRLRKQVVEPWSNHFAPSTLYDRSLNDGNFYTNSEYGLSQPRFTPEPVRFSQMPYMNGSSNYDAHSIGSESNFTLPIQSNHFLPDQPFENVERSFSEPFVMDNEMDQASQDFRFGLLGPTDVTGNNFNNDMMSGYGSFASNQPGSSLFSYEIQSFLNNENTACNPQPNLELPPLERISFSEPFVMDNKMDQTSQGFGFGLLGPTGNNFNNDIVSSYESFASNQPGSSHFSYGNQSFLNNENTAACNTQPNLELPPLERISFSEPFVMDNNMDQTSQGFGFGLLGLTGNNFNNDMVSSYESFASNQPGSRDFSNEIQSLLNNGNTACNPLLHASTTTQPNHELPPLDNLNLYSDLDQQQQGEDASTTFDLSADFSTELNQILSLGDLVDFTSVNTNQDHFDGETSNTFAATETNPPISDMNPRQNHFNGETSNILSAAEENPSIFNMNPNQNQEQDDDVSGFFQWSSWEPQELLDDGDFTNPLSDMYDMTH